MRKHFICLILVPLLMFIICACGSNDAPPSSDTPEPAALQGVFESEVGSFEFNGDGKTVTIHVSEEMAEKAELPEGDIEAQYVFLFHGGSYRYDKAEYYRIIMGDQTYQFDNDFTQTNEDRIVIRLGSDDEPTVFEKKEE